MSLRRQCFEERWRGGGGGTVLGSRVAITEICFTSIMCESFRMVLTPFGGTFFDIKGEKKKKWFWYNITGSYVHAPPFQPITFAWTKELSLRCMGQVCRFYISTF